MLTQFQIIQRQAALLAACPRPRALALSATKTSVTKTSGTKTVSVSSVITLSAPSAPSVWSHSAPISAGARVRSSVPGATGERPRDGYAATTLPVPMAAVRPDFAALVAEGNGKARRNDSSGTTGTTGSNNLTQQDEQYLTARRGPVTWRPPH
jgi:hypothetical protein